MNYRMFGRQSNLRTHTYAASLQVKMVPHCSVSNLGTCGGKTTLDAIAWTADMYVFPEVRVLNLEEAFEVNHKGSLGWP